MSLMWDSRRSMQSTPGHRSASAIYARAFQAGPHRRRLGRSVCVFLLSALSIVGMAACSGGGEENTPVGEQPGQAAPDSGQAASSVIVSELKIFRDGVGPSSGLPSVSSLPVGDGVMACFTYERAGVETALVVAAIGPNGSAERTVESEPFHPRYTASERCEQLPGSAQLTPGRYALVVEDRGQERARGEITFVAPSPRPSPSPEPTPSPAPTPTPAPEPTPDPPTPVPATAAPATPPPTPLRTPPPAAQPVTTPRPTAPPATPRPFVTSPPAPPPPQATPRPPAPPPPTAPPVTPPPATPPPTTPPPATPPPATPAPTPATTPRPAPVSTLVPGR